MTLFPCARCGIYVDQMAMYQVYRQNTMQYVCANCNSVIRNGDKAKWKKPDIPDTCHTCKAKVSVIHGYYTTIEGKVRVYCPRCAEFRRKWEWRGVKNVWGDVWDFNTLPFTTAQACHLEYLDLLNPFILPTFNATDRSEDTKEKGDATMRVEMTDDLFGKVEEGDDDTKIRHGGFDIYEGGKIVARCRAAVTEDGDGKVKFSYAIGPAKDFGFDATKEGEFEGDVAAAFFELIGAAREYVDNSRARGRGHDSSSLSFDINL